jgi:transcriptional regulator with XRE-family HTH domain
MNVGRRIREVREELGMPVTVLARRSGVAPGTVYRIESGDRTPSMSLLERLARELRTEPAELLKEPVPKASAPSAGQPSRAEQVARDAAERAQKLTEDVPARMQRAAERMARGPVGEGVSSTGGASEGVSSSSEASALLAYFLAAGMLTEDDIAEAREALRRGHVSH